ncbi:MAG: outer membrane beta-barrel protein [Bacteroidetes bacterium]|nr:outer membrane beta-barrel protein [Bacteroidota bacterium]
MNIKIFNIAMLKGTVFVFFLLIISHATLAQKKFSMEIIAMPSFTMGGEYDVNKRISNLPSYIPIIDTTWIAIKKSLTFGYEIGVALRYKINNKMSTSLGLLFTRQGQNYQDYSSEQYIYSETISKSVSLNYLKLPVQFQFTSNPEKKLSILFSTGFYFAFLVNYNDETIINDYTNSSSAGGPSTITLTASGTLLQTKYNDYPNEYFAFINGKPYKSIDFGGILGIGIQLKLSDKMSMPLNFNYQIGFVDIKNQSSQVLYGYNINSYVEDFWKIKINGVKNYPNMTLPYHNSSLGLKIGLDIKL